MNKINLHLWVHLDHNAGPAVLTATLCDLHQWLSEKKGTGQISETKPYLDVLN